MLMLQPAIYLSALQDLIKRKASVLADRRACTEVDMTATMGGEVLFRLQVRRVAGVIGELDDGEFGGLRLRRALASMRWDHDGRECVGRHYSLQSLTRDRMLVATNC